MLPKCTEILICWRRIHAKWKDLKQENKIPLGIIAEGLNMMKLVLAVFDSQILLLCIKRLHQIKGSSILLRWFDTVINGLDLFSRADRSRFLLMTDKRFISEVTSSKNLASEQNYPKRITIIRIISTSWSAVYHKKITKQHS